MQFILESTLSQILKTQLTIVGCGRTDAQVHASQFFFHVDIESRWDYDLIFRLNKSLPDDIAVYDVIPMAGRQHARFDATSRTYNYFIHTTKDPFLNSISSLYLEKDLRITEMSKAVSLLPSYTDYRAFCKNVPADKSTLCHVTLANLYVDDTGNRLRFEIAANRFLSGMIRIMVHQLLKAGRGEITVTEFEQHLISKTPPKVLRAAYPQGLYLSKVTYPFLNLPTKSELFHSMVRDDRWKKVM